MAAVSSFVVDEADVDPVRADGDSATTRLTFEAEHLEQRVIRFAAGRAQGRAGGSRPELPYVVAGSGQLELAGERHAIEPGTGAFVAPGESWAVENPGPDELLVVSVTATADLEVDQTRRRKIVRF